jgi:hypothetical protein
MNLPSSATRRSHRPSPRVETLARLRTVARCERRPGRMPILIGDKNLPARLSPFT